MEAGEARHAETDAEIIEPSAARQLAQAACGADGHAKELAACQSVTDFEELAMSETVQVQPNWAALAAPAFSENEKTHRMTCESCGLPIGRTAVHYKVPGLAAEFCSVSCIECVLFGPGRCRWCGAKTDNRFCGDACRKRGEKVPFGNGVRLLTYLEANLPALYAKVMAAPAGCARCKGSMEGKRADAKFCSDACKQAEHRNGGG